MSRYRQPYTLFKRGKYWYYRTYNRDGVRTTAHTTGCTSKTEAKKKLESMYLQGTLWQTDMTFRQYAEHFFDDNSVFFKDRAVPVSLNTKIDYQKRLKILLKYTENCKLSEINYSRLKQLRIDLYEHYSPKSIQGIMNVMKTIVLTAYRDNLIAGNPFVALEPMRMNDSGRDAFTIEEIKFIVENISEEFKKTVLLMALTGMRISEAVGVTVEDVKKGACTYIELTRQFSHKQYIPLKNKKPRSIPITPKIEELIGFDNLRLSAFYREFNSIKNRIEGHKERKLAFHSLRHFFITSAKAYGIAESKVETIAGHSLQGIAKVYTNYKVEDVTELIEWQNYVLVNIGINTV